MEYTKDYNIERNYFDKLNFKIFSESEGDITLYSCPECNEGKSFGRKHRCHWKYDSNDSYIHCFNCGFAISFEGLIKKYLGEEEYRNLKKDYGQGSNYTYQKELIINELDIINSPRSINVCNIEPIKNSKYGMNYLKSRKLEDKHENFYIDENNNLIIPFFTKNKKWFGYQTRILKEKMFWIKLDDINKKFKSWNFYNINLDEPVYIFEGVEDALSCGLDNVISSIGKNVSPFIMNKIKKPIICFDNDLDGIKSMAKHVLKYNCKALIYPKDFKYKDMNEALKDNVDKSDIKEFILNNVRDGLRLKIFALSMAKKDAKNNIEESND